MPDTSLDSTSPQPSLESRVSHLEQDMGDVKSILAQMLPMIVRIDATMPHLATKAELATGLAAVDAKIGSMAGEIARVAGHVAQVEGKVDEFRGMAGDVARVAGHVAQVEGKVSELRGMAGDIARVAGHVAQVEGKVDEFRGMAGDIAQVARHVAQVEGKIGELRGEVLRGDAALHSEMHSTFAAIRADLAEKPSKTYLWMVLGALIMAYAAGLAALAVLK